MASFTKRGTNWFFRYINEHGTQVMEKGCPDKRATEEMARKAETEAAQRRRGLNDPFAAHRKRPIGEHVDGYLEYLRSKGNTAKHVDLTETRLRAVIEGCGFQRIGDLEAAPVSDWLARQREKRLKTPKAPKKSAGTVPTSGEPQAPEEVRGISPQTSNYYLQAITGFARWLVKHRRMSDNPLAPLSPISTKADRRHDRGSLDQKEFDKLLVAAREGPPFRGLTGEDRAMLYTVAAYTGLRASELASLTPAGFNLAGGNPTVTVRAAYTKNGEPAELPLRPDLARVLKKYLAGRPSDERVWPGTWVERSAKMLKSDLDRANVKYVDSEGRYRDFHSLRHRFGTEMARARVHPKTMQVLMRHSTITLTLDRYTHTDLHDKVGAVASLPAPVGLTRGRSKTGKDAGKAPKRGRARGEKPADS